MLLPWSKDHVYRAELHDFIGHRNIAGRDLSLVVFLAREVALCLQFLNESCRIIHGNVKARNFVARGVMGLGFAAIDLDNAASIVDCGACRKKIMSTGYMPPEQVKVELFQRKQVSRVAGESEIVTIKVLIPTVWILIPRTGRTSPAQRRRSGYAKAKIQIIRGTTKRQHIEYPTTRNPPTYTTLPKNTTMRTSATLL
jgi:hypothetical protein